MSTIRNPFERAGQLIESLDPLAARYLPSNSGPGGGALICQMQAKLNDERINVMVFGTYNAGKSTLINALLGQDKARIGDVPTTDTVDRYDWRGHVLLDTPGVNAPIEHEEVSKAELQRTDLVLFVVRGGDQDVQDLYDRLFELLKAGRPVFLLLNHEAPSPEAAEELRARLNFLLLDQATQHDMPGECVNRIPVVLLNAKSAKRGRLENKALLCARSGYNEFVDTFNRWLARFDDEHHRLDLVRKNIERQIFEPLRAALDGCGAADAADAADAALQAVSDEIAHLERERSALIARALSWVRAELSPARNRIGALLDSGDTGRGLQAVADELNEKFAFWFEKECGANVPELGHVRPSAIPQDETKNAFNDGVNISDTVLKAAKGVGKAEIKKALLWGRDLGLPVLKGRWASTLGRWAGKAAGPLQVVIEVGNAMREEAERNRQVRAAVLRRHQCIDEVIGGLESSFTEIIKDAIDTLSQNQLAPLEEKRNELLQKSSELIRDRAQLDRCAEELAALTCAS